MQLKSKTGLALIVLGIGILGAWTWWSKTRVVKPLDIPVSLTAGQPIISEFKLNFDALYLIEIDVEKTIPADSLDCLLALQANPTRCKDVPAAVGVDWILFDDGRELQRGTSLESHSAPLQSGSDVRVIGEFNGRAGRNYRLQVTPYLDGTRLSATHPRLIVATAGFVDVDFWTAGVLVFSTAFICMLFGVILLIIAYHTRRKVRAV